MNETGPKEADFLTNQRVEGELLAERLARGPLAADDALRCAVEIAAVLAKAHARGQVHGGLSPWSIVLTGNGGVRLLSPPVLRDARAAAYRAPEQVRGEAPDARSDIFAFGALLYEMTTGRAAFRGTGAELDNSILAGKAAVAEPKPDAYRAVEKLVAACLEPACLVRRQRIQNVVNDLRVARAALGREALTKALVLRARAAVESARLAGQVVPGRAAGVWPGVARGYRNGLVQRFWVVGLAVVALAATAVAAVVYFHQRPSPASFAFRVDPPQNTVYPGTPAVSPDGGFLTFSAVGPEGERVLWLRPLGALRSTPITGTEGGTAPFWSPDSRNLAFFAGGSLKRVSRDGGQAEIICPTEAAAGGGTWNRDGTILFAPGLNGDLYRVAASANAKPEVLLKRNRERIETGFLWPQFLPDQKHFLFFVQADSPKVAGIYAGALGSTDYQRITGSETNAVYSPVPGEASKPGYILFMHQRTLMGQRFNADRLDLQGEPIALVDDVGSLASIALAPISASSNGVLVYQAVRRVTRQLVWCDRNGKWLSPVKEPGDWGEPRISPDGSRAVASRLGADGENADLWMIDAQGNAAAFATTPIHEGCPAWSPDGARLAFFESGPGVGNFDLYTQAASGAGRPELLFRSPTPKYPSDWSRDGRFLLFTALNVGTKSDVWAYSTVERRAEPILGTINNEGYAALSPDGRWLAFQSDEAGSNQVYVQVFAGLDPAPRRHFPVSSDGGGHPRWRRDGTELYYMTPSGRLMAVAVHPAGDDFRFDPPVPLFQTHPLPKTWTLYDVAGDGEKFLLNLPLELTDSSAISVFTNWTEKLRQQAVASE